MFYSLTSKLRFRFCLIAFICGLLFKSCESKLKPPGFENPEWKIDTIKINNVSFIRAKQNFDTKGLMRMDGTTLFEGDNFIICEYEDINNDSYEDIRAFYIENNLAKVKTYFYNRDDNDFDKVLNTDLKFEFLIDDFYYSYSEFGCQGWKWESVLLTINDYQAINIKQMTVNQCDGKEDGIFVYDIYGKKRNLWNVVPFSDELVQQSGTRFEFIRSYWTGYSTMDNDF